MKKNVLIKILVTLAYFAVITVNYLANALPIGGVTTGEASDSFSNLFTPAGVTFSIWGLIYTLLLVYVLYNWGLFGKKPSKKKQKILNKVGVLFIVNAIANCCWIFAWHHGQIALSVIIMLVLLITLILVADLLNKEKFSLTETICLRLPFSIYFGWITVATIANITVLLVSIGWNGWGISEQIWTIIILLIGATIGIWRGLKDKNIAYLAVFIWAYGGIILKHSSENGFANTYPAIIATLILCVMLYSGTIGWIAGRD
jgi:hypothetical protein